MEALEKYVQRAQACAASGSGEWRDEDPDAATYWQREAQIEATLAVAAALHDLRTMLSDQDAEAFIRVAGHVFTEPG